MTESSLLVFPGWDDAGKDQFERLEAALSPAGWTCRRADLPDADWPEDERRHVSREDNLRQALEDHDALARGQGRGRFALLGFSYGGYIAALVSAQRPVSHLILRSPALYPDDDWTAPKEDLDKRMLDAYRHHLHGPGDNRALAACAAFRGHALLVSSELDRVIPPSVIESYLSALQGSLTLEHQVLPGADHLLSRAEWRDRYHRSVVDWLRKHPQPVVTAANGPQ
jgi:pimeloyl-ACP methyl ester carboxylesterase